MGNNYYKNYRRYRRKGHGRRLLLGMGGVLLLVLALMQFPAMGDAVKSAATEGKNHVVSVFQQAADWGKTQFGGDASFTVPVNSGVVVEEYGVVTDVDGNEAYHKGIDIQVPAGSEVLAAADGKVADVSEHDDGTVWVTLRHEQNWSTVYGRLGEANVAVGDEVKKGDSLGTPANEILHFEVLEGETSKDPVGYFESGTNG
ncbi:MAG: M23 family metallopeptidase [Firmicutes bacterium]|nr:M23 family metallopeptidase [Bacillota bacterium]